MNTTQLCGTMVMTAYKEVEKDSHIVANSMYAGCWNTPCEEKGIVCVKLWPVVDINDQNYVVDATITTLKIYHRNKCADIVDQVSNLLAVAKKYNNGSFFKDGKHHNVSSNYDRIIELLTINFEKDQKAEQYENNLPGDDVTCYINVSSLVHGDPMDDCSLKGKFRVYGHSFVGCMFPFHKVNFGTWDTKLIKVDEMPGMYYHFY